MHGGHRKHLQIIYLMHSVIEAPIQEKPICRADLYLISRGAGMLTPFSFHTKAKKNHPLFPCMNNPDKHKLLVVCVCVYAAFGYVCVCKGDMKICQYSHDILHEPYPSHWKHCCMYTKIQLKSAPPTPRPSPLTLPCENLTDSGHIAVPPLSR